MTLAKRIIPCLDVDHGRVVKGINFLNLRRAQGLVALRDKYPFSELESTAEYVLEKDIKVTPKQFKHLLISFSQFNDNTTGLPLSDLTKTFIRDGNYFDHS